MEGIKKDDLIANIEENVIKRKAMFLPLLCISTFALVGYVAADKEAPVINSSKLEVLYGNEISEEMFDITDNRDDFDALDIEIDDSSFDSTQLGTYNVPVTATDRFSNTSTKNVAITVVDKTAPVLSTVGSDGYSLNIEVKSSNDIKNYINASDNVDGDVTSFIQSDVDLDTSKTGTQNIMVSVDDSSGNKTEKEYVINVVDTTAPTIKLTNGSTVTVDYGSTFKYKKYVSISDNYDEKVSNVKVEGEVDTSKDGDHEITIIATDSSGNSASKDLTVTVSDLSAPKIKLSKSKVTVKYGASFNAKDYLASASDNKDGDITSKVEITNNVNTKTAGKYTVTYSVSDKAGNSTSKNLTVTVQPKEESHSGIVGTAKSKLGSPYKWGSTGPNTFDCSGFTQWVYRQNGKSIPRTSSAQKSAGTVIPLSQAQPGDIVWRPGHVGIYVGNGTVIHSPHSGSSVSYTSASGFSCAVRY